MRDIPLLFNHDHTKPIGIWRGDGVGEFNADQRITREMLFNIFGGAGVRVLEWFDENGELYVRKFEIFEFSICGVFEVDSSGVVREFKPTEL